MRGTRIATEPSPAPRPNPARGMKLIESAAAGKGLYAILVSACLSMCTVCGIEGGLQLHLSHDHPAFACVALAMSDGENSPPCTSPDEAGQPWRVRLVALNMAGFFSFGMLWSKLRSARRKLAVAREPRDRVSDW